MLNILQREVTEDTPLLSVYEQGLHEFFLRPLRIVTEGKTVALTGQARGPGFRGIRRLSVLPRGHEGWLPPAACSPTLRCPLPGKSGASSRGWRDHHNASHLPGVIDFFIGSHRKTGASHGEQGALSP